MKVGVMLPVGGEPRWPALLELAECVAALGLDSVWVADHLIFRSPNGVERGTHECWTLMTALAATTARVEIGSLVLCAGFRNPGLVAKMAATLDRVAQGRLILGVGAGF